MAVWIFNVYLKVPTPPNPPVIAVQDGMDGGGDKATSYSTFPLGDDG